MGGQRKLVVDDPDHQRVEIGRRRAVDAEIRHEGAEKVEDGVLVLVDGQHHPWLDGGDDAERKRRIRISLQ